MGPRGPEFVLPYLAFNTPGVHCDSDVRLPYRSRNFIGLNLDFEPLYQLQCCPLPRLILLDSSPQQATRHGSKTGGRPVKFTCKDEIIINNFIKMC